MAILGDSIAAASGGWPYITSQYKVWSLVNHAVNSMGILVGADNMDVQTLAAANDDADVIILALGANDNNAGDMAALQAEATENILELQASNPRARICYLNVLPCWTDGTGATEQAKDNIRAAITAACAATGITCWDSHTTPWIVVTDTSDGIHPTAAGTLKIAYQVLARL